LPVCPGGMAEVIDWAALLTLVADAVGVPASASLTPAQPPAAQARGAGFTAQALPGGYINFVWRVSLDTAVRCERGGSVILKYSPPYIASSPTVPFDQGRSMFEARALALLGGDSGGALGSCCSFAGHTAAQAVVQPTSTGLSVSTPLLLADDPARHVILMSDCGSTAITLQRWLQQEAAAEQPAVESATGARHHELLPAARTRACALDAQCCRCAFPRAHAAGAALGDWIATLHVGSHEAAQAAASAGAAPISRVASPCTTTRTARTGADLPAAFNNAAVQATRNQHQYHGVGAVAVALAAEVAAAAAAVAAAAAAAQAGATVTPGHATSAAATLAPRLGWDKASVAAVHTACAALGDRLEQCPGVCLVMGDLWPRSVLVTHEDTLQLEPVLPAPGASGEGARNANQGNTAGAGPRRPVAQVASQLSPAAERQWLIDWEMCHWGNPAQDVAHLAAHAWMLHHAATHGVYGMSAVPCRRTHAHGIVGDGTDIVGDGTAGGPADGPETCSLAALDEAWLRHSPAAVADLLSSAAAYWRGFSDAYTAQVAALRESVPGGGSFPRAWATADVPAAAVVHVGAEVLARLGAFRQGYVYDRAEAEVPSGDGDVGGGGEAAMPRPAPPDSSPRTHLASESTSWDAMVAEALDFACGCVLGRGPIH
jgi:hypothetical protein